MNQDFGCVVWDESNSGVYHMMILLQNEYKWELHQTTWKEIVWPHSQSIGFQMKWLSPPSYDNK